MQNRVLCALVVFLLPVALRLALLYRHPRPVPSGADDFGYILLADTLRHFRLASPPHALPEFFEQVFVLQRPTYSSMFNLGQGVVLAAGWLWFGQPWAGVLLSVGALAALTYWMLLAWTTPEWSFAGTLLAVMLFGPLCYWTNAYWGGAVAACAGCLVFGAVKRQRFLVMGLGIAIHLLVRPYESIFLVVAAALFTPWRNRRVALAIVPIALALCLIGLQNKAITGSATTLPYQLYRYDYGIPATFTFQRNAVPHMTLNPEKQADYAQEVAAHGFGPLTLASYFGTLSLRVRFVRFFLFAPLYVAALPGLWFRPRMGLVLLLFGAGSTLYPYFYPHYVAAVTCVVMLLAVTGLERLRRVGPAVFCLCVLDFACWYGVFAFRFPSEQTWEFVNGPDPQGRATIARELARQPGKQLVFVHYSPDHRFSEWVHNAADIDASRVIYVNDLDPVADQKLRNYYPDRHVWLLEPDQDPPALGPYPAESTPFLNVP